MKKYLAVAFILFCALILATACGTTGDTNTGENNVNHNNDDMHFVGAGQWEHLGNNEEGREQKIVLNLQDDGEFELTVADEGTVEGSPDQTDALVKGTYTAMDDVLELKITEVDGDETLLAEDVKADATIKQSFVVEDETNELVLSQAKEILPSMPATLIFERVD